MWNASSRSILKRSTPVVQSTFFASHKIGLHSTVRQRKATDFPITSPFPTIFFGFVGVGACFHRENADPAKNWHTLAVRSGRSVYPRRISTIFVRREYWQKVISVKSPFCDGCEKIRAGENFKFSTRERGKNLEQNNVHFANVCKTLNFERLVGFDEIM